MDERFKSLYKMEKKEKIGIFCENPVILSCLRQIIFQEKIDVEIIKDLEKESNKFDKVFLISNEKKEVKENYIYINNFKDLLQNYKKTDEDFEIYADICICLGKLFDLMNNISVDKKNSILILAENLARSLNIRNEEIRDLKIMISFKNIKNILFEIYSKKNEYSTREITPSRVEFLLYEFFIGLPTNIIDKLFLWDVKKSDSILVKILKVCEFYIEEKNLDLLRKQNFDPFIVEKLISIVEKKKVSVGKKILLVDQEKDAPLIKLRLENSGFEVFWEESANEGLKLLDKEKFDTVLSNLVLPGMDGFSFLDKIKNKKELQNIPFIFISSKSDAFTIKKALALGANDLLSKPLDLDILISKIYLFLNLDLKTEKSIRYSLENIPRQESTISSYDQLKPNYVISNRFNLIKDIGEGGMGKIFLADDLELNEKVVLKFLKKTLIEDLKFVSKFKEEVKIARKLTNPSIVRIYDFWEVGELKFITQEYVDGRTLREILKNKGAIPISLGIIYAKNLANVFSYAHSIGVLHRDIKPDNIMITNSNQIKILDFGIAKVFDESNINISHYSDEVFGTPEYMSPEQLCSKKVDERSDIYSLGVVFYEIFCGDIPFKGSSKISIALKQIQSKPVPPRQLNEKIPQELEKIILKMLEKEKEKRFSSMKEVEDALRSVVL